MTPFENCIESAVASGNLDREDADAILAKFRSERKSLGIEKALANADIAWQHRAKIARLNQALMQSVTNQMQKDFSQYRDARGRTNLREAMMAKFESDGYSGYPGVKQVGETYIGIFNAKVVDALEKFHRKFWSGKRQNANLVVEVRKALHGEPTTPEIKALSNDIADAMEFMRTESNKYGGHIPKLEDWGNPQSHDVNAVGNFGRKRIATASGEAGANRNSRPATVSEHRVAWRSFIKPLLNWSKMYDPVTGEKFDVRGLTEDRKDNILDHTYYSIVSEGRNDLIPTMRAQGLGFGGSREEHRFLVFNDAMSQEKYDREAGKGDVFSQIMSYGHGMAREIALKKVFGPNPPARIEWMKSLVGQHVGFAIQGKPNLVGSFETRRNWRLAQKPRSAGGMIAKENSFSKLLDNYYAQFRGEQATSNSLSIAATIIGNVQMGALLGSSVIPHMASNWYIQAMERRILGMPMTRAIPSLLTSFGKANHGEMLRAGLSVEDGAFNVGQAARQIAAWHKIANWTRLLPDRVTTWSFLTHVVDANKVSFQKDLMGVVADHMTSKWSELPPFLRNKMAGYGLNEDIWKIMQLAKLYEPAVGSAKWIRWVEIADVGIHSPQQVLDIAQPTMHLIDPKDGGLYSEALERAAQIALDAAMSWQNFLHGEREVAVPQSSARARAAIIGQSNKSTWGGFMRSSVGLFKGFIGSMSLAQLHANQRQMARGLRFGLAHAAFLFIGLTQMGMISYQLKQIAAGKDPVNMDPTTPEGRIAWLHAMLTGGSFGLAGDLLASDHDSYGHGWAENFAGPMVNLPADLLTSAWNLSQNALAGKRTKVPWGVAVERSLIKFVRNNMPILTTHFLTRAAYQRIIVDQLQYMIDPDANVQFKRQEENTYKSTGQTYWWRPGALLPDRAPDLSRAFHK